jgi:DNA uptake protein ComE-like DNA-binding protein
MERKGVVTLIVLILMITAANFYLAHHQPRRTPRDYKRFVSEMRAFEQQFAATRDSNYKPSPAGFQAKNATRAARTRIYRVNINQADSGGFERLPGIGPILARRIVRYRSLLGGFYDPAQLKEVYGISDSLYIRISRNIWTDSIVIRKLNLNVATEFELARHPYIGKSAARGIIQYRSRVHSIRMLEELSENGLVTSEALSKLEKYLDI